MDEEITSDSFLGNILMTLIFYEQFLIGHPYYNSDVIVIDLQKCRQKEYFTQNEDLLVDALISGRYAFAEQDFSNGLFMKKYIP